jgi:hypothetical protein
MKSIEKPRSAEQKQEKRTQNTENGQVFRFPFSPEFCLKRTIPGRRSAIREMGGSAALWLYAVAVVGRLPSFQCPAGWAANVGEPCTICPAGRYSVPANTHKCAFCPTGRFGAAAGAIRCAACPVGKFRPETTLSTSCPVCPHGRSTVFAERTSASACRVLRCHEGHSLTRGKCKPCAIGRFNNRVVEVFPPVWTVRCHACPAGKFQSLFKQAHCIACPVGQSARHQNHGPCEKCAPGKYRSTAVAVCARCKPGKYQPDAGQEACLACLVGQFEPTSGCKNFFQCCKACAKGMYARAGSKTCTSCERGRYQPNTSSAACVACQPGRYEDTIGCKSDFACCKKCAAGQYAGGGGAAAVCPNCPLGKFQPRGGQDKCIVCPTSSVITLLDTATAFDGETKSVVHRTLDFKGSFSVVAWIRTSTGGAIVSVTSAGANGKDRLQPVSLRVNVDTGCLELCMGRGRKWVLRGQRKVIDNAWHHVSAVVHRTRQLAVLAIDGRQDAVSTGAPTFAQEGRMAAGSFAVHIGGNPSDEGGNFIGQLAHVTYFESAASNAAIMRVAASSVLGHTIFFNRENQRHTRKKLTACHKAAQGQPQMLLACDQAARLGVVHQTWRERHEQLLRSWQAVHLDRIKRTRCRSDPVCPPGHGHKSGSSSPCTPCAAGRYSSGDSLHCGACPAGKVSAATGKVQCLGCLPGRAASVGNTHCAKRCHAGQLVQAVKGAVLGAGPRPAAASHVFVSAHGVLQCRHCPGGKFSRTGVACQSCKPGQFSAGRTAAGVRATSCYDCPAGQAQPAAGSMRCNPCPPHQFSESPGASACLKCPHGKYQLGPGKEYCSALVVASDGLAVLTMTSGRGTK